MCPRRPAWGWGEEEFRVKVNFSFENFDNHCEIATGCSSAKHFMPKIRFLWAALGPKSKRQKLDAGMLYIHNLFVSGAIKALKFDRSVS